MLHFAIDVGEECQCGFTLTDKKYNTTSFGSMINGQVIQLSQFGDRLRDLIYKDYINVGLHKVDGPTGTITINRLLQEGWTLIPPKEEEEY